MLDRSVKSGFNGDVFTNASADATTQSLRRLYPRCAACHEGFDGHTYRFFSCHPVVTADNFLAAARSGDWASVHAMQTPSVDQPLFVVYAIACPPEAETGGIVSLLRLDPDGSAVLDLQQALAPEAFAALRALCPTCQWIAFTPALQSGQENV